MKRHVIAGFLSVGAAVLAACSPAQEGPEGGGEPATETPEVAEAAQQPDDTPMAEELERTGRVVVSGTGALRMVSLQTESGEAVGLTGDLLSELTRLAGGVVSVAGSPARTMQGEGVDVARYDVVSIDGETPTVGVLAQGAGGYRLEGEDARALVGVPEELASEVGAKIWVVGPDTPDGQRVRSYGVIRPAG
jgi:hypothetical protein